MIYNKISRIIRLMIVRVFCYNTLFLGGLVIVIPLALTMKYFDVPKRVCAITADLISVLLLVFRYKIFNYFIKFER